MMNVLQKMEKKKKIVIKADNVGVTAMAKVVDYCIVHANLVSPRSNRKIDNIAQWDDKFVKLEPSSLCELASAAYHLEVKPLVDLTCQAIAHLLKGKSPAEIRKTFNIPYDFSPEDDAPPPTTRDKLRNKLCDPKRKEKENKREVRQVEEDQRSVDELLSFINNKNKKKKKKKKKKKATSKEEIKNAAPPSSDAKTSSAKTNATNNNNSTNKNNPITNNPATTTNTTNTTNNTSTKKLDAKKKTPNSSSSTSQSSQKIHSSTSQSNPTSNILQTSNKSQNKAQSPTLNRKEGKDKIDLNKIESSDEMESDDIEDDPEFAKEVEEFRKRLDEQTVMVKKMSLPSSLKEALKVGLTQNNK